MCDIPSTDPHAPPRDTISVGRRILVFILLALAVLNLYTHGSHIVHQVVDACAAALKGDFAKVLGALGDLFPVASVAWASHAYEFYHHVIDAAVATHADIAAILAYGGVAKVALGIGIGALWLGAFALVGFTYVPVMAACKTWAGKTAWTLAYVGVLVGCYEVSCLWKRWRTPAQAA